LAQIQEIKRLSKLNHPNIVRMLGYTEEMPPQLVLELMDKGDSHNYLGGRKDLSMLLPWLLRIEIAIHIVKGLVYLHGEGVIHRDIKSPNVLLCHHHDGNSFFAKLADFWVDTL
jgi:serine/threonine protein kinase